MWKHLYRTALAKLGGRDRGTEVEELPFDDLEAMWFGDDDASEEAQTKAAESLAVTTLAATGLKPFPAVARQAMDAISSMDDVGDGMKRAASAIEADPAMTLKLIGMANSAAYAGASACDSVHQALVRIGATEVRTVVSAVATMGMYNDVSPEVRRIGEHGAGVAAIARQVATKVSRVRPAQAFLAALLHDVGKLMLAEVKEFDYAGVDPRRLARPDMVHELERKSLGYDHAVLGGHVLALWQIHDEISRAVAWHHHPGRAFDEGGTVGQIVALIRFADRVEYLLHVDPEPRSSAIDYLEKDSSSNYLEITGSQIREWWPAWIELRDEMAELMEVKAESDRQPS